MMSLERGKIVSCPVAAGAYGVGIQGARRTKQNQTRLVHAVELDGDKAIARVLCAKVKVESLLDDEAVYDKDPVSCPACVRILYKKGLGKPV